MQYFKIDIKTLYSEVGRIASSVEGKDIEDAEYFFDKIGRGEIIDNAPLFDYFYLTSYDKKQFWEWKLNDVHSFIGEGSQIRGWFISEKLKKILHDFNISKPCFYYPSKLLYRGEKLDYYVFQFAGKYIAEKVRDQIIFKNSIFFDPMNNKTVLVNSKSEFIEEKKRIFEKSSNFEVGIEIKKLHIVHDYDFFPMGTFLKDNIVSENLKQSIIENGITGFEFSELDYEVTVM